jgi:hypothetical protein
MAKKTISEKRFLPSQLTICYFRINLILANPISILFQQLADQIEGKPIIIQFVTTRNSMQIKPEAFTIIFSQHVSLTVKAIKNMKS